MLRITDRIQIDESELQFAFVRASGPGGQNVNKVSTAVQLRYDVAGSTSLSGEVKRRMRHLAGRRLTEDGILVIEAKSQRTQLLNKQEAIERLCDLVRRAAVRPKPRRATRPTRGSVERRLTSKKRRSDTKRSRGRIQRDD